ncbi:hypothetical protein CHH91_04415 [Virgibacillus sp. 7505]|uniref:hypothetical protein n=1 Tax=Virgibacillus sp. 7505 TaxID=2022548 RepID=UPI000BA77114|nr:hypothetical protein [Virgibacillus sp. 7505]PAE17257.1 hypothetical protein CHH91_04415 [Virgibacillus sp. 7505]
MKRILAEQFKPSDIAAAEREIVCIKDMLIEAQMDVDKGFYEGLILRLENATRSAKQMLKMQEEKTQSDEILELVQEIEEQGRVNEMYRRFKGKEAI